jgi:hypothetical protein
MSENCHNSNNSQCSYCGAPYGHYAGCDELNGWSPEHLRDRLRPPTVEHMTAEQLNDVFSGSEDQQFLADLGIRIDNFLRRKI